MTMQSWRRWSAFRRESLTTVSSCVNTYADQVLDYGLFVTQIVGTELKTILYQIAVGLR